MNMSERSFGSKNPNSKPPEERWKISARAGKADQKPAAKNDAVFYFIAEYSKHWKLVKWLSWRAWKVLGI